MRSKGVIFILAVLAVFGCDSNDTTPNDVFTVSGFITYNDESIEDVNVSIDDKFNLSTLTDGNGYFEIPGVAKGDHQLNLKKELPGNQNNSQEASTFTEKTLAITVNEDTEINNLRLPRAVQLYEAANVTASSAEIRWSPTDDSEFREYKLYQHNSSGLDESTGTLIHVSTSLNDTTYLDSSLNPLQDYFYRIYVMDDFGRIGGSNIIEITTENVQLIANGGFEELINDVPSEWSLTPNELGNPGNSITVDSSDSSEGNNSIEFHHAEDGGCWEMWISQTIDKNSLVGGGTYRLTLDYKSDFTSSEQLNLVLRNPTIDLWLNTPMQFEDNGAWKELSYEFGLPTDIGNNNVELDLHFCIAGIRSWWLDDVRIERIE